jgi:hypothetical protein
MSPRGQRRIDVLEMLRILLRTGLLYAWPPIFPLDRICLRRLIVSIKCGTKKQNGGDAADHFGDLGDFIWLQGTAQDRCFTI